MTEKIDEKENGGFGYPLLGAVFTIDNLRKYFTNAIYSEGSGKHGTTKARVLKGDKWHVIESPRYENKIKCWVHINGTKEVTCNTINDLVNFLNCA